MIHCRMIRKRDYISLPLLFDVLGYPSTPEDIVNRMDHLMQLPQYEAIVAVNDKEEIFGFVGLGHMHYFERAGTYGAILAMAVRGDKQRQGIGTILIEAAEAWASDLGCDDVVVSSGNRNERKTAHQFYQKYGYLHEGSSFVKCLGES